MTMISNKKGFYHGVEKGNGNLASGYHGTYFEDSKEIPKLIKKLMNIIIKDEILKRSDCFQITGIYIDYDLKMIDIKYVW